MQNINKTQKKKNYSCLKKLKKLKISVGGPLIADTVFVKDFKNMMF